MKRFTDSAADFVPAVERVFGERPRVLDGSRAVQLGDHNYPWFQRDKNWDTLRSDATFENLMREVEGYWKQYVREFAT